MRTIIFYKLNGQVKSEEILTKENLEHINGMMTKCTMTNGTEEVGFADPKGIYDKENYDELDSEITNTVRMNIDDTYFEFGIFDYVEGQDNDDNWTDIKINVHNNNFKYFRKSELMTSAEVERLLKMIEKLLNDELEEKEKIRFYEPDLEFILYPKINLWDTGKYAYIKEGHEIQDIYMELNINLTDRSGVYTGQKYVMIFDRKEVEKVVTYMKTIVNKK